MADRELHVKITGDASSLQKAASEGEQATESFGQKAAGVLKGLAAFAAGSALAQFFRSASDAVVEFEGSTRKLEATAKITGTALGTLQGIAERGQKGFGLSATLANDYAVELAKLASKAGDVGKATPLLGAFLDLGAARGLSAGETLKAVQQAILGIDEGTDKLFNKNPSVLYKEYADAIGTTAGKLTDQQKAIALVNAALVDGGKVGGEYNTYLDSYGGKLSLLSVRYHEFLVQVGKAVFETEAGKTVTNELVGALVKLRQWVEANEDSIGNLAGAIGRTVVSVGNFIGKLVELVRWFDTHVPTLDSWWQAVTGGKDVKRRAEDTTKIVTTENGNMLEFLAWAEKRKVKVQQESEEERAKSLREFHKDVEAQARINEANVYLVLAEARKKLQTLNEQTAKDWLTLYDNAQKAHGQMTGLLPIPPAVAKSLEDAAFKAQELGDAMYNPGDGGVKGKTESAYDGLIGLGRAMVDLGDAGGVVSSEMGRALDSVLNLAASVARFGIDPMGGIVGVLGALSSLIAGWGTSAAEKARMAAMKHNTDALIELTASFGDYNGSLSGKTASGVLEAVGAGLGAQTDIAGVTTYGTVQADRATIERELNKRGLTYAQAKKIAESYGFDVEKDPQGWYKFFDFASKQKFGSAGNDFTQQMASLEESFGVLGVSDADEQYREWVNLIAQNVPALAEALKAGDPATKAGREAIAASLRQLYRDSIAGNIPAGQYGKATPGQFRQMIGTLLGLLGNADGFLGNGNPVGPQDFAPAPPPGATAPSGPVGASGMAAGSFGLVSAPDLPPVPVGGGVPIITAPGAGGQVPANVVTINGGLTITNNWPDIYDSREAAELMASRVSDVLGLEYARQRAALGVS